MGILFFLSAYSLGAVTAADGTEAALALSLGTFLGGVFDVTLWISPAMIFLNWSSTAGTGMVIPASSP